MKRIFRISSLLALYIACTCCSGLLEQNPTTTLSGDAVYDTEAVLESHVRSILAAFQDNSMYTHDMPELLWTGSCLTFFPQGVMGANNANERWSSAYHYTQASTTVLNTNMYANHYSGIARANQLINNLPGSPVDDAYKVEIEAEARFLRAVLYFSLVRLYGDVPLITEMPSSVNDTNHKRDHYCDVYHFILEELDFAAENMRSAARVNQVCPGEGRADKWAALAFKSAVYNQIACILEYNQDNFYDNLKADRLPDFSKDGISCFQDAWLKGYEAAVSVINGSDYRLARKYTDLFTWDSTFCSEDGYGSWNLPERIFCLVQTTESRSGQIARRSLPPFPEGTSCIQQNSNFGRFRPTRFVFQKWAATYGGEMSGNIYINCTDPRFDATLIHTRSVNISNGGEYAIYPAKKGVESASRQYMQPYFKKYLDPLYNGDCGNSDFYFMRFAEVYLLAAEAAAGLCASPDDEWGLKAYEMVEHVHARARATREGAVQPVWESGRFATRDELVAGIFWEKVFELYGEGHEWFETHKRGAAWFLENVIKPFNEFLMEPEQDTMRGWYTSSSTSPFPEDPAEVRAGLLCAFPQEEIMYNSALSNDDKNDFYWK